MSEDKDLGGLGADLRPHYSRKYKSSGYQEASVTIEGGESRLSRIVSGIDEEDATSRYREEEADNHIPGGSRGSASSSIDERIIIAWAPNDPENPYNWSNVRQLYHTEIIGV